MSTSHILSLSCDAKPGLGTQVLDAIAQAGTIRDSQQYGDAETGRFFMRVAFDQDSELGDVESKLKAIAEAAGADWNLHPAGARKKVILMVSKFDHCLGDLIYRWQLGELPMDIVGVINNHPREVLNVTIPDSIPYHHFPMEKGKKAEQEQRIKDVVNETGADLVVLARYMQILSDDLAGFLSGRCINIHHSFLPGFKGAKPYHQAHARGVKMIGATSHYVTADLDEGPIIAQDVDHITHADTPDDLVRKGRDIERRVLARAVLWHLQDRVFRNKGNKTVVFRD